MSEPAFTTPRPVGLASILGIFVCLGLFWLALRFTFQRHHHAPAPYNIAAENESKDDLWQATPEARLAYLQQLRAKQNAELQSYGWTDKKNGVVQIPIERAMQLVAQEHASSSPSQ